VNEKSRLLGVALSGLTHGNEQLDLLDAERRAKLEKLPAPRTVSATVFGSTKCNSAARSATTNWAKTATIRNFHRILRRNVYTLSSQAIIHERASNSRCFRCASRLHGMDRVRHFLATRQRRPPDRRSWSQFGRDARSSYGFYGREFDWDRNSQAAALGAGHFTSAKEFFWALLLKMSPARRVLLLVALVMLLISGFRSDVNFEIVAADSFLYACFPWSWPTRSP